MKLLRGFTVIPAVAAMAATTILLSATPSDAKATKLHLRCKAETETTQIDTRYEERTNPRKTRKRFRAQFEGSGVGLVPGAQLAVVVDSVTVGSITLVQEVPGEVEGQLRFDSKGRLGKKAQPFPSNFPVVVEGTLVELTLAGATVIGCELD